MIEAIVFNAIMGLESEEKGIKTSDLLKISKMDEKELDKKIKNAIGDIRWVCDEMELNLKATKLVVVENEKDYEYNYINNLLDSEYKRLEARLYKVSRLKSIYELALKVRQDERAK